MAGFPPRSFSQLRDGPQGRGYSPVAEAIEVNRPYPKRAADAVQAFGEHFGVYAHADAKVIGHFEKATRNC